VVKRSQMLPLTPGDTFDFCTNPRNLPLLTPSPMKFRLVSQKPAKMGVGTELHYQFQFFRIPFHWRLIIEAYDPPDTMVIAQQEGPFTYWKHFQTFKVMDAKATEVRERFEFALPYKRIGEFGYRTFLKAALRDLFDHRANQMDTIVHRAKMTRSRSQTASK
jgi:ribosome-associated toxin RatA of RatAB toxin-antitoxin module